MTKGDRYAQQLGQEPELGQMPTQADIFYPTPAPIPPRRSTGGLALKDGEVQIGAFTLTSKGLQISSNATQDEWRKVGDLLSKLEGSIQWLIGDWVAYGEGRYGDIKQVAEIFGRKPETLYNYASVSRSIETSRRREVLSFGHHYEVIGLEPDEQDQALEHAAKNGLSVSKFRQWIKEQKGEVETPSLPHGQQLNIGSVSREMEKFWLRDPATAKRADHEKARQIAADARRAVEAFERKWGIE